MRVPSSFPKGRCNRARLPYTKDKHALKLFIDIHAYNLRRSTIYPQLLPCWNKTAAGWLDRYCWMKGDGRLGDDATVKLAYTGCMLPTLASCLSKRHHTAVCISPNKLA